MTDKKQDVNANIDVMLADVMLRITALEKLLMDKKVFSQEELITCTEEIAKRIAKNVLEKMQGSKDLKEFISKLEDTVANKKEDKKGFDNN